MLRRLLILLVIVTAALLGTLWFVCGELSAPAHRPVGAPPAALAAKSIQLTTADGVPMEGWWSAGKPGQGVVLLLHGVRGDRRQMINRALFLHRQGRATLLLDLPAHGESGGDRITFGHREAEGVATALAFIAQQLPCERRAVIGVSLGAAATVLVKERTPLDAVVLESMYPTVAEAVEDRLRLHLGAWAGTLSPLLLSQMPWRLGITADDLRPIDHVRTLDAPVLIMSGSDDHHTTRPETQRVFDAASAPKSLWLVPGAAHVDLMAYSPQDYTSHVSAFLAPYLNGSRCPA